MSDNLCFLVRELAAEIRKSANSATVDSPEKAYAHFEPWSKENREHVLAIFLNVRREMIGEVYVISIGTQTASLVHPREVFYEAVKRGAHSFILSHNHPSGITNPSPDDLALTRRIRQAGEIMGIGLADHIIIGNGFTSLKERGEI